MAPSCGQECCDERRPRWTWPHGCCNIRHPFKRASVIHRSVSCVALLLLLAQPLHHAGAQAAADDAQRLVGALAGDTPLVRDLQSLTDEVGGRATGSAANARAVAWALARFREAGVDAKAEQFTMPVKWLERSASATIRGDGVEFGSAVAAM